jgi:hypothetical protein
MERSEIRERPRRPTAIPDYASPHPGYGAEAVKRDMPQMTVWDWDGLSKEFFRRAERADDRMRECRSRVPHSSGHKYHYDMALAEFYTFHRLHGRTFLSSPKALVKELRDMKALDFKSGLDAYDKENFERLRIAAIDELLHRFEPLANYARTSD